VVAQTTGANRPNCKIRVLLRSFAATAWKRAKTSPRTLARTDLAASPWQRPVSQFRPQPAVPGEIKMVVIPHPPYSPDLTPCEFFLFLKPKLKLKWRRFDTTKEIQAESQRELDTLTEMDFQEAFQKWRRRWDRCLHAEGNYFEGDGGRYTLWWVLWFYSFSSESFGFTLVWKHERDTIKLHYKSSWGWTFGCSEHVEDTTLD
jgi:hypothetical protein